jgi:hypothetical protein
MSQEDAPVEAPEAEAPASEVNRDAVKTFDADYVKTLRNESASYRKKAQELEQRLSELEERDQSELQKAQGKAAKAEQAKADAEAKLIRYEVAAEKQVPADALDLLTGTTREELEAKADKLLELTKNREPEPDPDFDGGAREPAPDPKTPEESHNDSILKVLGLENHT